ncbi:MAG TPA: hypothetical protein VIU61_14715 [Kofleriaceae bacterium]
MKALSLVALALVGCGAAAKPASTPSQPTVTAEITASEYEGPIYKASATTGWSVLTEPTEIRESRQKFHLGAQFEGIALQNVKGSSHIKMVDVVFTDGSQQSIKLGQTLNDWQSTIPLALLRGKIDYIVVHGTTNVGSSYRLLGA